MTRSVVVSMCVFLGMLRTAQPGILTFLTTFSHSSGSKYPLWRDGEVMTPALRCSYAHGPKELPTQLYRANVSQLIRPLEDFPLYFAEIPANGALLRFDRQSPDFQFVTSQVKFADSFGRMSQKLRS